MASTALNDDDRILELGTAIQQLRSAEGDVAKAESNLANARKVRDDIAARVDRLRAPAPAATATAAAATTAAAAKSATA